MYLSLFVDKGNSNRPSRQMPERRNMPDFPCKYFGDLNMDDFALQSYLSTAAKE
jgi:hypothetical protein